MCLELVQAHEITLQGVIKDSLSGEGLPGVSVLIKETGAGTITNELGKFHFHKFREGTYHLAISYIGYETKVIAVSVNENTPALSVLINSTPIMLKEVNAASTRQLAENVGVVSDLDLHLRPVNSAQDLLRLVPGLFLAQHQGGGKAEQIFLRGFDCDHGTDFAVFLDGMPVNMVSHAHGQGYADFHFVIPETIDKLTVYKGPYATKFGDFATAGAGEFNTKSILDKNLVKLELGSFNTQRAVGMFNLLGRKQLSDSVFSQSAYIAGEYNYTDSYFDHSQHYFRYNIFGKYTARYKSRTLLNFSASTFNSGWDASGQVPTRAVAEGLISRYGSLDPTEGGTTNRTNVNLSVLHAINDHSFIKSRSYYSNYNFNLYSNFTFFLQDSIHGDQVNQQDKGRNMFGYMGSYENYSYLSRKKLTSVFGLSSRADRSEVMLLHSQHRTILDTFVVGYLNQENVAGYIDETLQLTSRLRLNAGLRFDYFFFGFKDLKHDSLTGKKQVVKYSPKLNITYSINENIEAFVHAGYGFHSNDARAVVQRQIANQNNVPTALGYESGVTFKAGKNLLVNMALWGIDLRSELVYDGDVGVIESTGPTRRYGADLGIRWQIYKTIFFDADINYSHSRLLTAPEGKNYLPLSPVITSVAGLSVKGQKGLGGSLRYRYMSSRPANEDNSIKAIGYFLLDALVTYTTRRFQFGVSAENLLNATWNQAQFETLSRLKGEIKPVDQLNFTPGAPLCLKGSVSVFF